MKYYYIEEESLFHFLVPLRPDVAFWQHVHIWPRISFLKFLIGFWQYPWSRENEYIKREFLTLLLLGAGRKGLSPINLERSIVLKYLKISKSISSEKSSNRSACIKLLSVIFMIRKIKLAGQRNTTRIWKIPNDVILCTLFSSVQ